MHGWDNPDAYIPKPGDVAGVDLVGWRQPDGTLKLGATSATEEGTTMEDFPAEVTVAGRTYTLEDIKRQRENVPDLKSTQPGYWLEWGIYV